MGKKGSWFAVIKRFFTPSSKDKVVNGADKKDTKEKKKRGSGKPKHGEVNSFIPLSRRPSSTEKILADAEREKQHRSNQVPPRKFQHLKGPAQRAANAEASSSKTVRPVTPNHAQVSATKFQPGSSTGRIPIFQNHAQVSATKIQAAYRGYRARRTYRSLMALLRLQGVMRGQGVKQQTANTIRCMRTLVRVQLQIRAGRLQTAERKGVAKITPRKDDSDFDGSFSKWSTGPDRRVSQNEAPQGRWDGSVLTKEAAEARLRRKVEAVMNRERALAYAYSHQLLKVTPTSARAMLTDLRSARSYPWWWTWLERQIPSDQQRPGHLPASAATSRPSTAVQTVGYDASVGAHHRRRHVDAATPRSSATISSAQQLPRRRSYLAGGLRDDASLTSCPPFAAAQPNYMTPTASAAAKVRAQRQEGSRDKKKRFSFGLGHSIGFLFSTKETSTAAGGSAAGGTQRVMGRGGRHHRATPSIGGTSVNSAMSLPAASFGRRNF